MFKRFAKKILIFIIILSTSINVLAAVVNDTDMSAFMTKSEFEALKNNFQNQLDSYNTSMESKIDGAISSYLAGVKLESRRVLNVINADWDIVSMYPSYTNNVYQYPDLSLSYNVFWQGNNNTDFSERWKATAWWYGTCKYSRNTTSTKNQRLICDAGAESSTLPDSVVWLGKSVNLYEKFTCSLSEKNDNAYRMSMGYLADNDGRAKTYICDLMNFKTGYFGTMGSEGYKAWRPSTSYEPPRTWGNGKWITGDHSGQTGYVATTITSSSASLQATLLAENGKNLSDEHILTWNNISFDEFTDPNWTFTINKGNTNTLQSGTLLTNSTKEGIQRGSENGYQKNTDTPLGGSTGYGRFVSRNIDNYYAGWYDNNTAPPSVGLLNKSYDSEHILQTKSKIDVLLDEVTYSTTTPLNLINGLPILYGSSDKAAKLKWEPVFKTYVNNVETNFEVCVELIMNGRFLTGNTTTAGTKICKNEGQSEDYLETTNRKCTFNFSIPANGIVYVKWWPKDDTIRNNNNWRIDLDLSQCGTFIYQFT